MTEIEFLRQQLTATVEAHRISVSDYQHCANQLNDSKKREMILRDAVQFAADTTDRGEVADVMNAALTATVVTGNGE